MDFPPLFPIKLESFYLVTNIYSIVYSTKLMPRKKAIIMPRSQEPQLFNHQPLPLLD